MDFIQGNAGNDTLRGGAGENTILGNAADDLIHSGPARDTLNGGAVVDTISSADAMAHVEVDLRWGTAYHYRVGSENTAGFKAVIGSAFGDTTGSRNGDDPPFGDHENSRSGGDDVLVGGRGKDTLDGGPAQDILRGGFAADRFVFREDEHSAFGAGDLMMG